MNFQDIYVLIVVSLLLVLLPAPGLYKMFQKAGIPAWKAYVPFYNTWEIVQAAGLRRHWFFWQFIPVAGWFITLWFFVEWVKLFGKFKLYQHAAAALVPFFYFPYIGYNKKDKYLGMEVVKKQRNLLHVNGSMLQFSRLLLPHSSAHLFLKPMLFLQAQWKKHCW